MAYRRGMAEATMVTAESPSSIRNHKGQKKCSDRNESNRIGKLYQQGNGCWWERTVRTNKIPIHIRKDIQPNSIQCPVTKRSSRGKEWEKDGEAVVDGATENVPSECNDKYNVDDGDNDECSKGRGREDIASG